MGIKAIETEYNGYKFRSRLEARWAVFFDAIGAKWEYEPEGYVLDDGTMYLPDFLLHDVRGRGAKDIYVEIKGVLTERDLHKVELFSGMGDYGPGNEDDFHPIVIFGQIPDCKRQQNGWRFDFAKDDNEMFYNLIFSEPDFYWTIPMAAKGGGLVLDYPDDPYEYTDEELTARAYIKAKQARFEHGETPMAI